MRESDWDTLAAEAFDADVVVAASPTVADTAGLSEEEYAAVAAAVPRRQSEFAAARACARRALAVLGCRDARLPASADGSPRWPADFVGSISHAGGRCIAAVARAADVVGIGIDVEMATELDPASWPLCCTAKELDWLRRQEGSSAGLLATALFSAKESVWKALPPGQSPSFEPRDIEIDWDGLRPDFMARVRGFEPRIGGKLILRHGWIVSGAARRARSCLSAPGGSGTPPRRADVRQQ